MIMTLKMNDFQLLLNNRLKKKTFSLNSIKQLIYSEYYFQIIRYFPGINLIYMFYYKI